MYTWGENSMTVWLTEGDLKIGYPPIPTEYHQVPRENGQLGVSPISWKVVQRKPYWSFRLWTTLEYWQTGRHLGMDQYLLIPFLGGWTSIYQLFWCSPGVQGFDTLPFHKDSFGGHSISMNLGACGWLMVSDLPKISTWSSTWVHDFVWK